MGGDDGDFIGKIECEVSIDEDEDVGYSFREGERVVESCPRMWICVENDGE